VEAWRFSAMMGFELTYALERGTFCRYVVRLKPGASTELPKIMGLPKIKELAAQEQRRPKFC
jgi:hypothetical protein